MARKTKKKIEETEVEVKVDTSHFGKQFVIILIAMIALILVVLLVYWYLQSIQKISYEGIKFEKQKYGNIIVYYYYYNLRDNAGNVMQYNLYLRNDPRGLAKIPVIGNISYPAKGDYMYVSANNTGFETCENTALAMWTIGAFLSNNYIDFNVATPDQNEAKIKNISYADCEHNLGKIVLLIQTGNVTKITKKGECYVMEVADCKILEAAEKWELQSIVDARKSSGSTDSVIYSLK